MYLRKNSWVADAPAIYDVPAVAGVTAAVALVLVLLLLTSLLMYPPLLLLVSMMFLLFLVLLSNLVLGSLESLLLPVSPVAACIPTDADVLASAGVVGFAVGPSESIATLPPFGPIEG